MKIVRIFAAVFSFLLIFTACETEDSLEITNPEAELRLLEPGVSNINLNFGLPDNPALTLVWNDQLTSGSSYDIEISPDPLFESPVVVGNSTTDRYTVSVNELNMIILSAGGNAFEPFSAFFRVKSGSEVSNDVSVTVISFAENAPVISNPASSTSYALSIDMADDVVLSVDWSEPDFGEESASDVSYRVELSSVADDFSNAVLGGSSLNDTTLDLTHSELNQKAIGLGIEPETEGSAFVRVVASITNAGGSSLERISDTVEILITPYATDFPYLYFVGASTPADWNNNNINPAVFRSQDTPNSYYYTGYFTQGGFKILEQTGEWNPQWGDRNGNLGRTNDDGEPGVFDVPSDGYYTMTMPSMVEGGSYTIEAFDASSTTTYNSIGLIGQAIGGWGDGDEIELIQRDPVNNPHLWYANGVNFTNGEEFLIRPNDDWNNGVWRYTGSDELFGQANLAGSGDNFPFSSPTGAYDVWFNDLDGSYVFIPND